MANKNYNKKKKWQRRSKNGANSSGPKKTDQAQETPLRFSFKASAQGHQAFWQGISKTWYENALFKHMKKTNKRALLEETAALRPKLFIRIRGSSLTEHKIVADECLPHDAVLAMHAFGHTHSMRVIGEGMKDKHIVPELYRTRMRAIFTTDRAKKNQEEDLSAIIKRVHDDEDWALRHKFFEQNRFPLMVVLPHKTQNILKVLQEQEAKIIQFLNHPGSRHSLDLSRAHLPNHAAKPANQLHSFRQIKGRKRSLG